MRKSNLNGNAVRRYEEEWREGERRQETGGRQVGLAAAAAAAAAAAVERARARERGAPHVLQLVLYSCRIVPPATND